MEPLEHRSSRHGRCANCGASFSCENALEGCLLSCSAPGSVRTRPRRPLRLELTCRVNLQGQRWSRRWIQSSAVLPNITSYGCMIDIGCVLALDVSLEWGEKTTPNGLACTLMREISGLLRECAIHSRSRLPGLTPWTVQRGLKSPRICQWGIPADCATAAGQARPCPCQSSES